MSDSLTLSYLPLEDIIFKYIFPSLDIRTLFILKNTCTTYRDMVQLYFERMKNVDIGFYGAKINESSLMTLLERNYCCQRLVLRYCKSSLSDRILQPMLEKNRQLCHIDITNCSSLSNSSLQTLATSCSRLKRVSLRGCVWATPEAVTNLGLLCNKMEFLDLSGCWNINDDTVCTISESCHRLSELNLSRIYGITDKSIKSIARNCSAIRILNIRDCWRVTDDSLWMLMEYCTCLKVLQVKGCRSVTWSIVDALRKKGVVLDCLSLNSQLRRTEPPIQI